MMDLALLVVEQFKRQEGFFLKAPFLRRTDSECCGGQIGQQIRPGGSIYFLAEAGLCWLRLISESDLVCSGHELHICSSKKGKECVAVLSTFVEAKDLGPDDENFYPVVQI